MIEQEVLQNLIPPPITAPPVPLAKPADETPAPTGIIPTSDPRHPDYTQTGGGGGQPFQFPFPEQWGTASNVLNQFAQTGMPTDVSGMSSALWDVYSREAQDLAKQLTEQAGVGGRRFGTPLQRNITEQTMRAGERVHAGALPFQFQAEESARGRQMGTVPGLQSLGRDYLFAPADISGRMFGMGQQMQQARQQELSNIYNEFLRTTPEASPWLQYAQGAFGGQVPYGAQMYQPGMSSQLMDFSSMLAMMQALGGMGGG